MSDTHKVSCEGVPSTSRLDMSGAVVPASSQSLLKFIHPHHALTAKEICRLKGRKGKGILNLCMPCIRSVQTSCTGEGSRGWVPQHALNGHYGAVVDMRWDAGGRCLHTVSEDQTSRIFSACKSHWCEIARPQVGLLSCAENNNQLH